MHAKIHTKATTFRHCFGLHLIEYVFCVACGFLVGFGAYIAFVGEFVVVRLSFQVIMYSGCMKFLKKNFVALFSKKFFNYVQAMRMYHILLIKMPNSQNEKKTVELQLMFG